MLVDIGSNIDITGIHTAREFDQQSRQHGRVPKVMNVERLLHVHGVGSGAAMCRTLGTFTLAHKFQHHDEPPTANADAFVCNVPERSRSNQPATLGLTPMQPKRAVLILEGGRRRIIYPGAHSYKAQHVKVAQ
eukprot:3366905-Pyramimonas_sp.AAC.1